MDLKFEDGIESVPIAEWLGQWLHVGKNTTMGMEMYSLSW
jgi:hypothetical protein